MRAASKSKSPEFRPLYIQNPPPSDRSRKAYNSQQIREDIDFQTYIVADVFSIVVEDEVVQPTLA
jgi:hypothetical protein